MKKVCQYFRLGAVFLVCTAIYAKITKARIYDSESRLSVFSSSTTTPDIGY